MENVTEFIKGLLEPSNDQWCEINVDELFDIHLLYCYQKGERTLSYCDFIAFINRSDDLAICKTVEKRLYLKNVQWDKTSEHYPHCTNVRIKQTVDKWIAIKLDIKNNANLQLGGLNGVYNCYVSMPNMDDNFNMSCFQFRNHLINRGLFIKLEHGNEHIVYGATWR